MKGSTSQRPIGSSKSEYWKWRSIRSDPNVQFHSSLNCKAYQVQTVSSFVFQDRVTDHRIHHSEYGIQEVMEGLKLDAFIGRLATHFQLEKLKEFNKTN